MRPVASDSACFVVWVCCTHGWVLQKCLNQSTRLLGGTDSREPGNAVLISRAEVQLKFLIAINLVIEKNRKVKTRQYVSILLSKAQFISLKSRNLILECSLKWWLWGYCHYRPNQLFQHASLLTLAGKSAALVLLTMSRLRKNTFCRCTHD